MNFFVDLFNATPQTGGSYKQHIQGNANNEGQPETNVDASLNSKQPRLGALAIPMGEKRHGFLELTPLDYAKCNRWIYGDCDLPPNIVCLAETTKDSIKFAYLKAQVDSSVGHHEFNILVIRGTDNDSNVLDDVNIIFSGGKLQEKLADKVNQALNAFEEQYGKCNVATGHSLGGRLVEVVVQHAGILGVTFNSLLANKDRCIIGFRKKGDIAPLHKGHTDRWVGDGAISPFWDQKNNHGIKIMVDALADGENYWTSSGYAKANEVDAQYGYELPISQNQINFNSNICESSLANPANLNNHQQINNNIQPGKLNIPFL